MATDEKYRHTTGRRVYNDKLVGIFYFFFLALFHRHHLFRAAIIRGVLCNYIGIPRRAYTFDIIIVIIVIIIIRYGTNMVLWKR